MAVSQVMHQIEMGAHNIAGEVVFVETTITVVIETKRDNGTVGRAHANVAIRRQAC